MLRSASSSTRLLPRSGGVSPAAAAALRWQTRLLPGTPGVLKRRGVSEGAQPREMPHGWGRAHPCPKPTAPSTVPPAPQGQAQPGPRQNPSMVGAGRALCGSPSPTPCPSRVTQSRLHSTASRGVGISPEKETPQPPWAAWARAPSPSEGRSSSSGSAGASSAPVCARCLSSCHYWKEPGPVLLTPTLQIFVSIY